MGYVSDLSPDGDQIAITRGTTRNNIYVINADGTHLTPLLTIRGPVTGDLDYLAFSPDGERIAYSIRMKGNTEIYAVNTDGTNQSNLTNRALANDYHPTFSPNGKEMAFESTSYLDSRKLVSEIYLMNLD